MVVYPKYSYIFESYGIEQIAIKEDYCDSISKGDIKNAISHINENGIKYIFTSDDKYNEAIEPILHETEVNLLTLETFENLYFEDIYYDTLSSILMENLKVLEKYE